MTIWVDDPKARGLVQVAVWVPPDAAITVENFARDIRISRGNALRDDLPSEKQVVAIARLCSERRIAVPPEALASRPAADAFLNAAKKSNSDFPQDTKLVGDDVRPALTSLAGGR